MLQVLGGVGSDVFNIGGNNGMPINVVANSPAGPQRPDRPLHLRQRRHRLRRHLRPGPVGQGRRQRRGRRRHPLARPGARDRGRDAGLRVRDRPHPRPRGERADHRRADRRPRARPACRRQGHPAQRPRGRRHAAVRPQQLVDRAEGHGHGRARQPRRGHADDPDPAPDHPGRQPRRRRRVRLADRPGPERRRLRRRLGDRRGPADRPEDADLRRPAARRRGRQPERPQLAALQGRLPAAADPRPGARLHRRHRGHRRWPDPAVARPERDHRLGAEGHAALHAQPRRHRQLGVGADRLPARRPGCRPRGPALLADHERRDLERRRSSSA